MKKNYFIFSTIITSVFLTGCTDSITEKNLNAELEREALYGNINSQKQIADQIADKEYKAGDYAKAAVYYEKAISEGDAAAQNCLGVMYAKGQGVKRDLNKAFSFFTSSAIKGWSEAKFNLGIAYKYGKGTRKDTRLAKKWFEQAALSCARNSYSEKIRERANIILAKADFHHNLWVFNWIA